MFQQKLSHGILDLWPERVSSLMCLSQKRQFRSSSVSTGRRATSFSFLLLQSPLFLLLLQLHGFSGTFHLNLASFSLLLFPPICLRATRPLSLALRANGQHSNGADLNTCMPRFKIDVTREVKKTLYFNLKFHII